MQVSPQTPLQLKPRVLGFTLAELLISLAILGVIATFTIPKVLQSQQSAKYSAIVKEDLSLISATYQKYLLDNGPNASMNIGNLLPYMNYISTSNTAAQLNDTSVAGSNIDCNVAAGHSCIALANGSMIIYNPSSNFGGTGSNNVNWIIIDPEVGLSSAGGNAVFAVLYYNGRLTSEAFISGTVSSATGSYSAGVDPPWFKW